MNRFDDFFEEMKIPAAQMSIFSGKDIRFQ